ncbi:site-specific integrase [Mucilaginibacter sp.]|uniref:site-specific integrase n=1 Tax=Mucilaginibacter sp. TaxID=1882438 RepID=UPI0038CDB445
MQIIAKYKDYPKCVNEGLVLPVLSNQKMNCYLKEIADACDIKQNLTFHLSRHTFATTIALTNGVPIESVSKMLGHVDIKTTQHYAKVIDTKVSQDMKKLRRKRRSFERLFLFILKYVYCIGIILTSFNQIYIGYPLI